MNLRLAYAVLGVAAAAVVGAVVYGFIVASLLTGALVAVEVVDHRHPPKAP